MVFVSVPERERAGFHLLTLPYLTFFYVTYIKLLRLDPGSWVVPALTFSSSRIDWLGGVIRGVCFSCFFRGKKKKKKKR